jgi:phosphoglycolate phosphatase
MHHIWLFDLDGTLIDTSPGIFSTANYTMRELGLAELSPTQLRKFVGPPLAACFRVACGLDQKLVPRACQIYRSEYHKSGALQQAQVYDGIVPLLETLQNHGVVLGVATLKLASLAEEMLQYFNLRPWFSVVSGSDGEGKLTKADIIVRALDKLPSFDRKQVLMVGDTPHDLDGAMQTHVDFVGVTWGFGYTPNHPVITQPGVLGSVNVPSELLFFR